ncbi:MAG TPA: dienelactone hydrolase family protein [Actinomycetes bacterium]|nr:dienelactone hydrolase family protein [Actinomycetes bacterium]
MTDVVLIPSVLGVRPAIRQVQERLGAGHRVHVVEVYAPGLTFDDYDPAIAHWRSLGLDDTPRLIHERVSDLPAEVVYAGFSAGAALALVLAATRPGARGALALAGGPPLAALGVDRWPAGVPVQAHAMVDDPFRDPDEFVGLQHDVTRAGAAFELFDYPGGGHLFADEGLPEYDAEAAALMWSRVRTFLAKVGDSPDRSSGTVGQ